MAAALQAVAQRVEVQDVGQQAAKRDERRPARDDFMAMRYLCVQCIATTKHRGRVAHAHLLLRAGIELDGAAYRAA